MIEKYSILYSKAMEKYMNGRTKRERERERKKERNLENKSLENRVSVYAAFERKVKNKRREAKK